MRGLACMVDSSSKGRCVASTPLSAEKPAGFSSLRLTGTCRLAEDVALQQKAKRQTNKNTRQEL